MTVPDMLLASFRNRLSPRLLVRALTLALTAAAPSCAPTANPGVGLPPSPPTVHVTMREYRFEYVPPRQAGRMVFRVRNAGRLQHDLALFPLNDDVPPIDTQLRGSERLFVAPFAQVTPRPPGGRGAFAVDLLPGRRYALVCYVADPDGAHAVKGMNAEFRVPSRAAVEDR